MATDITFPQNDMEYHDYVERLRKKEETYDKTIAAKGQKWDEGKQDWFLLPLEILEPLADAMVLGEAKGYDNFSCLDDFENSSRRFYNGTIRHARKSQKDPLAIDEEGNKYGLTVYHQAQIAFNALMRLYHARKQ